MMARSRTLIIWLIAAFAIAVIAVFGWHRSHTQNGAKTSQDLEPVVAVSVAPIVRATLHAYVVAWGTVEPEQAIGGRPPASARIASPVSGLVANVMCAEGQQVAQGAVLFELDHRLADVEVEKARQNLQYAQQAFDRQKLLGPGEATSQKAFQDAEQALASARNEATLAERQRDLLAIRSPLGGTVVRLNAKPGDAVDLTTVLAEVIDLNRLVVSAGVRSADVAKVRRGQMAELLADTGAPDDSSAKPLAEGVIVFIGSQVDPKTDTVLVRASVPPGTPVRSGQFLSLRIVTEEQRDRLAVPPESILTDSGATMIDVVSGDRAAQIRVTTGIRDGNLVEVQGKGLREGMMAITTGAYGLPPNTTIRFATQ